jgi:hypothetical protein
LIERLPSARSTERTRREVAPESQTPGPTRKRLDATYNRGCVAERQWVGGMESGSVHRRVSEVNAKAIVREASRNLTLLCRVNSTVPG